MEDESRGSDSSRNRGRPGWKSIVLLGLACTPIGIPPACVVYFIGANNLPEWKDIYSTIGIGAATTTTTWNNRRARRDQ